MPLHLGWTDDLLIATESPGVGNEARQISVTHVSDGQILKQIQVSHSATAESGWRARQGEHAGRILVAPNAEILAILTQAPEFRGSSGIDLTELKAAIAPGAAATNPLPTTTSVQLDGASTSALALYTEFQQLYRQALSLEPATLQVIVRLGSPTDWSLHPFFVQAERDVRRHGLTGTPGRSGISIAEFPTVLHSLPEPLPAASRNEPIALEDARAALSGGGAVADKLDHFESRPSQIEMLEAVTRAFNDGGHALVEAGTGTGKSFAYLIPAALFAARNNQRVVISTNTINLQDQLFLKDVPRVIEALGLNVSTAVVKGRSNYLCLRRWSQLVTSEHLTDAERTLLIKTILWLPHTLTGDRAELRLTSLEDQTWNRVNALPEACTPLRCQYHRAGVCFIARARRTADASHLVVINHALLLTDTLNGAHVLPDFDRLIIDEGHHLEDEATSQLGWSVTGREMMRHLETLLSSGTGPGVIRAALEVVRRSGSALSIQYPDAERSVQRCSAAVEELTDLLNAFLLHHGQSADGGQITLRITETSRAQPDWSHVEIAWDGLARALSGLGLILSQITGALEQHAAQREEANEIAGTLAAEAAFWDIARTQLSRALGERGSDPITWLTRGRNEELSLSLAPLEVGETLAKCVFRSKTSVIVTSATLTTAGKFGYVRGRMGLEECAELRVPSPFDYAQSTLVCAPSDLPEPNQPNYQRSVEWVVERVVARIDGRTLVLFTSHSQLRTTYEAVRESLNEQGILVLGQGIDGSSRDTLLQTFRSRQPAVLLGTSSFWEGVDVVGETLSCVIIPRLPFSVPTDPVFQARSELFEHPFREYAVPQAILRFRQGFGRLIRSQRDRGALLILDRRVLSKSYGGMFLKSLPEARLDTSSGRRVAETIQHWLLPRL
ncbi:MAG: ATP-dependent DNA helicase [Chloroflexota bacterium]